MKSYVLDNEMSMTLILEKELGQSESQRTPVITAKNPKTGSTYAIKMIDKKKFILNGLRSEIDVVKKLRHRNVAKLYKMLEKKNFIYLIMEKLSAKKLRE